MSSYSPTTAPNVNHAARAERAALADLLDEVGPDAATCCVGWLTRDLAAHLVLRERRPDAAAGIVLPPLRGWNEKVMARMASRPYADVVAEVREGPSRWSPLAIAAVDAASNTVEFFVHHEDVRRAGADWTVRDLDTATRRQLATGLRNAGRVLFRRSPASVRFVATDVESAPIGPADARVVVTGEIGECVLAGFGRPAEVSYDGDPADIEAFIAFER